MSASVVSVGFDSDHRFGKPAKQFIELVGTLLALGNDAVVEVTGLRNPCLQIDRFRQGLLREVSFREEDGTLVRLAGIMGIVKSSGRVKAGDRISVTLPEGPYRALDRV